jgi:hypothetical protein
MRLKGALSELIILEKEKERSVRKPGRERKREIVFAFEGIVLLYFN